ncbi:MAG: MOSC domain-containing protein [Bryobacteraceae bacterium]
MRVLSVQVGKPREVTARGGAVLTGIFKSPVEGKVALRRYNLDGDRQADLTVHGGPNKAVYLYPSEHYSYWAKELPEMDLPFGMFGENLTTEGVSEEKLHIGDRLRIGSAILQVSQPRMPCFKLGIRFGRADIVKRFWASGRPGIYFSVVKEGELERGDAIEEVASDPEGVSVADVVRLYRGETTDDDLFQRALRTPLSGSWKEEIRSRMSMHFGG